MFGLLWILFLIEEKLNIFLRSKKLLHFFFRFAIVRVECFLFCQQLRIYTEAAFRILRACDEKFCCWDPEKDSIVDGGTFFYHDPTGKNTEVPIIYGDYYLIESVLRLKGTSLFVW